MPISNREIRHIKQTEKQRHPQGTKLEMKGRIPRYIEHTKSRRGRKKGRETEKLIK
jgi:hypothetical protein